MKNYFKVPDEGMRKHAVGSLPGLPYRVKKSLEQVIPMFKPIDKPKDGDWLWDHEEEGQTYDAYNGQMHNIVDKTRNVIYIKPLEEGISLDFLRELKAYCECFFHPMKVSILKATPLSSKVDTRINQYTNKPQYNARQILTELKKKLKPDAFCLVGVCMTDLYPRDEWNFVFGIASIRERTGVFSFARYDESFFHEEKYEINYDKILWRSIGVMVHEITHMFGVRHCIFYNCLMNGSNHLEQSMKKPMQLCPVCLRKMQSNIKFDILQRYEKIYAFLDKKEDKRIDHLKKIIGTIIENIIGNMKKK